MRIAQIAPLHEAVPPKLYGGTERVVSNLTEALVEAGHDVTLFASGDSQTSAKLEAFWPQALRLDPTIRDTMAPHMLLLEEVRRRADEFDVLHFHIDYYPFSLFARQPVPFLTTLHGRLDLPELQPIFNTFSDVPVVSISDNQRQPLPQANWLSTVYHGLPENVLKPIPNVKPGYLAFLGRISPEKRVDRAIRIAEAAGMKIKIAAKLDKADRAYYEEHIKPLFALPHVEYIGEINEQQKTRVPRQRARAAVPDRLAGAVRPGDDRGDGLRHAGDRVQPRFGAGSDRERRVGFRRRRRTQRDRRCEAPRYAAAREGASGVRNAFLVEGHGPALCPDV